MSNYSARRPVIIVTGFLGSGKTTLLNHMLKDPSLGDAAVLVNEFGEVGLDHQLIEALDDNTVLLASGCVCCTIRDDLKAAVLLLHQRRERGEIPSFSRLIIETTGLADPTPIMATFLSDVQLRHHYRVALVITTVDSVNGLTSLERHVESLKQAATADKLVLTKTDLADARSAEILRQRLRVINLSAEVVSAIGGVIDTASLLQGDILGAAQAERVADAWLAQGDEAVNRSDAAHIHGHTHDLATGDSRHAPGIHSFSLVVEQPLDWTAFGIWLTMLLHCHGAQVLRVKGILHVRGVDTPVVINGVQHLVHPPVHLARWPDDDRRSRIVFIVQDLERKMLESSLAAFNTLAANAAV